MSVSLQRQESAQRADSANAVRLPAPNANKQNRQFPIHTVTIQFFNEQQLDAKERLAALSQDYHARAQKAGFKGKKVVVAKPPEQAVVIIKPFKLTTKCKSMAELRTVKSPFADKIAKLRAELESELRRVPKKNDKSKMHHLPALPTVDEVRAERSRGTSPCYWDRFSYNYDLVQHLLVTHRDRSYFDRVFTVAAGSLITFG